MLKRSFKLIMMFFGLTNSLATFQTMINKILRDLINIGEIIRFIDSMIVETEEEDHDKVIEEVVKRLKEDNLYLKPEKYK